jgi:ABC-type multidrug transport system fused ATPase/permease subunit
LPYGSLVISFLTYATFGWLLHSWTSNRLIWLAAAFGLTILGGFVTYPSRSVAMSFGNFFKTDLRALILMVLGSFIAVVLFTWLQFFIDTIVICAAGFLVSLDLRIRGWSKSVSLFFIVGWQLIGTSAGLFAHHFFLHPLPNLPPYFYSDYWYRALEQILN